MSDKEIDWSKPIEVYRGGEWRKARLLGADLLGGYPMAVAWAESEGHEELDSFTEDGRFVKGQSIDIRNVQSPGYINVYAGRQAVPYYESRGIADHNACPNRIACVKFTPGQFDD